MADDPVSAYGGFLRSVRDGVAAHKSGREPMEPLAVGQEDSEVRRVRQMGVLLEEVLDQLRSVFDRIDAVERVSRSEVVQLLRERTSELETTLRTAADVRPQLDGLREDFAGHFARIQEAVGELGEERIQGIMSELLGHLDTRMAAQTAETDRAYRQLLTESDQRMSALADKVGHEVDGLRTTLDDELTTPLIARMAAVDTGVAERLEAVDAGLAERMDAVDAGLAERLATLDSGMLEMADRLATQREEADERVLLRLDSLVERVESLHGEQRETATQLSTDLDERLTRATEWLTVSVQSQLQQVTHELMADTSDRADALAEAFDQGVRQAVRLLHTDVEELQGRIDEQSASTAVRFEELHAGVASMIESADLAQQQGLASLAESQRQTGSRIAEALDATTASLHGDLAERLDASQASLAEQLASTIEKADQAQQESGRRLADALDATVTSLRGDLGDRLDATEAELAKQLDRSTRALVAAVDEGAARLDHVEQSLAQRQEAAAAATRAEIERQLGTTGPLADLLGVFGEAQEHVLNAAFERLSEGPLLRIHGEIAGVDAAARRVTEAQATLGRTIDDLRRDNIELASTLRDLRNSLVASRLQLENIGTTQTTAGEVTERIWNAQSDLRTSLEQLQVGALQGSDLQQLVAEVTAVNSEVTRQQSWLHALGNQLSAISNQLRLVQARLGGGYLDDLPPASPPPPELPPR
jgi:murein DD-endopeptidase MepM/ murein hydrolase activator NlpD